MDKPIMEIALMDGTKRPAKVYKPLPPELEWKGDGPPPPSWMATAADGTVTKVYRDYAAYCDD